MQNLIPSIENQNSEIQNPPTHSLTLLLAHPTSDIYDRLLQFAAAASRGLLPITPALPDNPDAYLPPSLANFIPEPLNQYYESQNRSPGESTPPLSPSTIPPISYSVPTPASVLILNLESPNALHPFNPDPARIFTVSFPTLMPATRYIPTTSQKHPLYILHSLLRDNPAIRLVVLGNLPMLVGRQHSTLIPVLQDIAQIHEVALLAHAFQRPRPYPFLHHFTHIHTLPSFHQAYKLTGAETNSAAARRSAAEAPGCPTRGKPLQALALDYLQSQLASGPKPALELLDAAQAFLCVHPATFYRAKNQLQIISRRAGSRWFWQLPPTLAQHRQPSHAHLEPTPAHHTARSPAHLDPQPTRAQHHQPPHAHLEPTPTHHPLQSHAHLDPPPTLAQHRQPPHAHLEPTPAQHTAQSHAHLDLP